jgi:polysaccharide pyruvyl transferase WcaK-like protein
VSYEHKTEGLMQTLGLSHLCVQSNKATGKNLQALLFEVYEKKDVLKKSLASSLTRIKGEEEKRWKELFAQWLTLSLFVSGASVLKEFPVYP